VCWRQKFHPIHPDLRIMQQKPRAFRKFSPNLPQFEHNQRLIFLHQGDAEREHPSDRPKTNRCPMPEFFANLPHSFPARAVPAAVIAVFDGFTLDPVRGRLGAMQKEMDRALPRTRLFRH
jgi:hypothetical protein